MLVATASYFTLVVLALCPITWAEIQISHLEDWTTIPKFEISIDDSRPSTDNQLLVIDYDINLHNGTKYICSIPDLRSSDEQAEQESKASAWDNLNPEQIRSKLETNFEIALRGKCARKSEGFWSFEVCPFKQIRQIHTDADRELMSFSLGKFHRSYWVDDHSFVQEFKQGTDGRSCKAVFTCGPKQDESVPISFIEAREPSPLNYVMRLGTPSLCKQEHTSSNPFTLLYSLNSKCIFLNKGWWSYEFCHLGYVRQFHTERVKAEPVEGDRNSAIRFQTITTASFMLGRFSGNASDSDSVNNQTSLVVSGDSQAYFSQVFTDGSDCDLTGRKRETEIRFLCNRNIDSAKFVSIKESKTCSYLVEIELPSVCSNPNFFKKDTAIYAIKCTTRQNKDDVSNNPIESSKSGSTPAENNAEIHSAEDTSHQTKDNISESPQSEINNIAKDEL